MSIGLEATSFSPNLIQSGDKPAPNVKFNRSVKDKTVVYTTFFPGNEGKVFKLEVVAGEQLSLHEIYEEGDLEVYLTVIPDSRTKEEVTLSSLKESPVQQVKYVNKGLYVLRNFLKFYQKDHEVGSVRFVTYIEGLDLIVNRYIESPAFMGLTEKYQPSTISRLLGEKDDE